MSPQHAVRAIPELHELDVLDQLRLSSGCGVCRQNAIGVAVENECRNSVARDVRAKVLNPRIDKSERTDRRRGGGHVPVGLEDALAHELASGDVVVVKVAQKTHQQGWPIRLDGCLDTLEDAPLHAFRVVGRLHQIRA
jgi:hypothetical protein